MAKNISKNDIRKQDFLVLRQSRNNNVNSVIAPNGLQIGLSDADFKKPLLSKGPIIGEKGISGSLTTLSNGIPYLLSGNNITIATSSTGQITIAATYNNSSGAGEGISYNGIDDKYNIDLATNSGLKIDSDKLRVRLFSDNGLQTDSNGLYVDIDNTTQLLSGLSTSDKILVYDADAAALKSVTVGLVQSAGATYDIAGLANSLNESTLVKSDLFAVADTDASNEVKKITVEDIIEFISSISNSGISESSGKLKLDLDDLSEDNIDVASDSFVFVDSTDNESKKQAIESIVEKLAGTNTTTAITSSNGTFLLDITNQTDINSPSPSDELIIYDVDAPGFKKITVSNLHSSSAAPINAEYVTLASNSSLSSERILTSSTGISITDGGANNNVTIGFNPADVINESYGLSTLSNKIITKLKSLGGLQFVGGELALTFGSTTGSVAQGNNQVNILAGDGLRTGGSFSIGAVASSIQLDIKPTDFAGLGLSVDSNDLNVYLSAGAGILITTGSENNIVITSTVTSSVSSASASTLDSIQEFKKIFTSDVAKNTNVTFSGLNTSDITYSGTLDVFHNGSLLYSGSAADILVPAADYTVYSTDSLRFSFNIKTDDIITVKKYLITTGTLDVSGSYITFDDESSIPNSRKLVAGDGIIISTATPQQIIVSNSGLISRTKGLFEVTSSQLANVPYICNGVDFSSSSFDINKIDVFYNGSILYSGSSNDYILFGTNSLDFNFIIEPDDTIQVILF